MSNKFDEDDRRSKLVWAIISLLFLGLFAAGFIDLYWFGVN